MSVEERLAAVERALTDDEVEVAALSEAATVERRLDDVEDQLDRLEERIASVEAGVDAVRGHVGDERRAVDEVERTAATALATARRVERQLDETTARSDDLLDTQSARSSHGPVPDLPTSESAESSDGVARWLDGLLDRS